MKKKGIISLIILFVLLMILGAVFVFLYERDKQISLIQDKVIIEYGNTYNPKIEELIDLSKYNFINLDKVRIESNLENESEKDYPAVGRYQVNVYYRKKILTQEVEIKDTTKPELTVKDSIEIGNGIDLSTFDFKEFITSSLVLLERLMTSLAILTSICNRASLEFFIKEYSLVFIHTE